MSSMSKLQLMVCKDCDTEIHITQTFDRKQFLNAIASPLDVVVIACFSMCNAYYAYPTNFLYGLCTMEFVADFCALA